MKRGFEVVPEWARKNENVEEYILPKRSTKKSAGYDIFLVNDIVLKGNESRVVFTDICAYMPDDEVFKIYIRSSIAIKKGIVLTNQVGIIDADYYKNEKNYGNIGLPLTNTTDSTMFIKAGTKVAQGIFEKYYITDDDETNTERKGGMGSTG